MSDQLDVFLYGLRVGELRRRAAEDYVLEYDESWAATDEAVPLSLSLPLRQRVHQGRVLVDFIDNLLPDNPDVRQRWATDAGLDSVEPFFLLREYGEDVAGAASFRSPGGTPSGSRQPLSDAAVADRIRRLRADATTWHDDGAVARGQFSLAGAQAKFSLARHDDAWFEATGTDPSTHLFKPGLANVVDGELIEYLVMRTAYFLGIPAATVELFDHDDEHSLVVKRFDRRIEPGGLTRLHQEDLLQSLGCPRLRKFEMNGGPGIDEIARLLERAADEESRRQYAAMLMYSWIVLSTDAHAKNYSVFLEPEGARLTPLYDASSILPYLGDDVSLDRPSLLNRAAGTRLAVRYGATDLAGDVSRLELGAIARRCGMAADDLLAVAALQILEVSDTISDVASELPSHLQTDTVTRAVEWMPVRARQAAEALDVAALLA
jgi:serine/threonine-protein kinase HipA